jgi:hypothetical protein
MGTILLTAAGANGVVGSRELVKLDVDLTVLVAGFRLLAFR